MKQVARGHQNERDAQSGHAHGIGLRILSGQSLAVRHRANGDTAFSKTTCLGAPIKSSCTRLTPKWPTFAGDGRAVSCERPYRTQSKATPSPPRNARITPQFTSRVLTKHSETALLARLISTVGDRSSILRSSTKQRCQLRSVCRGQTVQLHELGLLVNVQVLDLL